MIDRCKRCDKPRAAPWQWSGPKAHKSGCACAECEALCWGSNCKPHDWRGEALRLREVLRRTHASYCTAAWTDRGLHASECLLYELSDEREKEKT